MIDIQITVNRLDDVIVAKMSEMGYQWMGPDYRDHRPPGFSGDEAEWAKLLFREPLGQRRINIHVRVNGRANQRYALLFRDYLRAHHLTDLP